MPITKTPTYGRRCLTFTKRSMMMFQNLSKKTDKLFIPRYANYLTFLSKGTWRESLDYKGSHSFNRRISSWKYRLLRPWIFRRGNGIKLASQQKRNKSKFYGTIGWKERIITYGQCAKSYCIGIYYFLNRRT